MKIFIFILISALILGIFLSGRMSHVEHPDYTLVRSKHAIEIRDYPPMLLAEVEVEGERKQAIKKGFKILADYIFGNNISSKKIEKTTPVSGELSEKIAMTAPVMQEKHLDQWKIRFIMPKKYTFETLPKPDSDQIRLIPTHAKRFAVIRFSGLVDDEKIKQHTEELKKYMLAEKLQPTSAIVFAFYNPPWTLPFLRRNEIMIEVGIDQ